MLKLRYSFYLVLLSLLAFNLTSCSNDSDDVEPEVGDLEVNLDKALILQLVNNHRANGATCGSTAKGSAEALTWNDELAKAALDHSNDMANNDYFSHTGLNNSTFSERATDAGYTASPRAENIAQGHSDENSVIQGWMNSEGHCNNIMNGNYNEIGVARSSTGNYWTMVLGKR